jgi:hypothetical protein
MIENADPIPTETTVTTVIILVFRSATYQKMVINTMKN